MKEEKKKDEKPVVVINHKVVIIVGICFVTAMALLAVFLRDNQPKPDNCINDTFDKFGLKDNETDAINLAYLSYLDYLRQQGKGNASILYQQQRNNVSNRTRDAYIYLLKCKGIDIG